MISLNSIIFENRDFNDVGLEEEDDEDDVDEDDLLVIRLLTLSQISFDKTSF